LTLTRRSTCLLVMRARQANAENKSG
jgi:hypothetical protein